MKKLSIIIINILMFSVAFNLLNAQSYQMIEVEGGVMELGATAEQVGEAYPKEFPAHQVELPSFMLGVYEVTQAEWKARMGDNPGLNETNPSTHPIEYMDWMSAIVFCNESTIQDASFGMSQCVYYKDPSFTIAYTKIDYAGNGSSESADVYIDYSKNGYRLPTEAEWEFAARGGMTGVAQAMKFAGSNDIETVGLYSKNSGWKSYPIGTKQANQLGLFDMTGNLWEMVNDWFAPYGASSTIHPKGATVGTHRVLRGGAYDYDSRMCRVSSRYMVLPDDRDSDIGFRMARNK